MDIKNKLKDRKLKEQEKKVDDILAAAKRIFSQKGFLKTTMDEIAYEAALSKPTIYKFFPTKEDLYFSLVIPVLEDCLKQMEEINLTLQLNIYSTGGKLLRDIANVFFNKYKEDPHMFRIGQLFQQAGMLWSLDKKTDSAIRDVSRAIMDEMRSIIIAAQTRRLFRESDARATAKIIMGSVYGITQLHDSKLGSKSSETMDKIIEETVLFFERAIVFN